MGGESPKPASTPTDAVFLSYASQDAGAAQRICEALRAAGIDVWFDQSELRGGDAWDQAIRKQIKTCALFIPVISQNTHARVEGYFRLEWKLAVDRSHLISADKAFLLPVVIDDTPDDDERAPERFREVQWTRLPDGDTPPGFVQRVAALLGSSGSDAAFQPLPSGSAGIPADAGRARILHARDRRWPYVALIAALVVGAVSFVLLRPWRFLLPPPANPPAPIAIAVKSVAVLPFIDLSEKKDQEYFTEGLTEELIDILTRVPGLRVPARTSSFYFKGKNAPIGEIARALNVATVLEGSVRKSGGHYRITVQLIRGDTGAHVWSKTFDREATNILDLESAIATAVGREMSVSMEAGSEGARTRSPEAYDAYLEGRAEFARQRLPSMRATQLLRKAVALDPNYAEAWSYLSKAMLQSYLVGDAKEPACSDARQAGRRALELDPHLTSAHGRLAWVYLSCDWDWQSARDEIHRLTEIDPNDSETLFVRAYYLQVMGDLDGAAKCFKEAIANDPFDAAAYGNLASVQMGLGLYADAERTMRQVASLRPDDQINFYALAKVQAFLGKYAEARTTLSAIKDESDREYHLAYVELLQGHRESGRALVDRLITRPRDDIGALYIARLYAIGDYRNQALEWIDKAFQRGERDVVFLKLLPEFRGLRNDAGFAQRVARLKLPEHPDPL